MHRLNMPLKFSLALHDCLLIKLKLSFTSASIGLKFLILGFQPVIRYFLDCKIVFVLQRYGEDALPFHFRFSTS